MLKRYEGYAPSVPGKWKVPPIFRCRVPASGRDAARVFEFPADSAGDALRYMETVVGRDKEISVKPVKEGIPKKRKKAPVITRVAFRFVGQPEQALLGNKTEYEVQINDHGFREPKNGHGLMDAVIHCRAQGMRLMQSQLMDPETNTFILVYRKDIKTRQVPKRSRARMNRILAGL